MFLFLATLTVKTLFFLYLKKKKESRAALTSGAVVGFGSSSGACGHEGENISLPGNLMTSEK